MSLREEYKSSLKSMDTEEHIDLYFYRPLGFAWAKLFAKLGVSPNAVTVASIFLGVAGGILLYFGQPGLAWLNYLGIFLIIWANTYDSADGQLARMTKQYSRLGRILDGLSGDFWFVAIYFALVFRELDFGDAWPGHFFADHPWVIWVLAVAAGLSHAKQAASADYYRQFHLYFLKGKEGSELDSTDALDAAYAAVPWQGNFWKKLTMLVYRNYTANQEVLTPRMQALRRELKERYGDDVPQDFRDRFRVKSLPLMKYTNMLSFNTRIIAMFVSVIIDMPWLYFVFELLVLNIMMVYMIMRHEHFCRNFVAQLRREA
ncbi:MAG: CDP-alcohol phosphatidyltransferase family protein [Muribaculaceae bacterium]|nr:CDP-alcohol phosphatidyltransferase family protein [Muribaculaceae bacterium]MBR1882740.1 CDP-alcohol phosphatidyltransferase family protein [Muribaculaceae bacterium]